MARIEVLRTSWLAGPCAAAFLAESADVVEVDDDDRGRGADVVVASVAREDLALLGDDAVRWAHRLHQRGSARLVVVLQAHTRAALGAARKVLASVRRRLRAVRIAVHVLFRLGATTPGAVERARLGRCLSLLSNSALESLTLRGER